MADSTYKKVSEITVDDLIEYLRIVELDNAQRDLLTNVLEAAKNYAVSSTGQSIEALDQFPDMTLAVMALSQDLYDNRSVYVDKSNVSETISTILGLYRINLL